MYDFINSLVGYLESEVNADTFITEKANVFIAFPQNKFKAPTISLQIVDSSSYDASTTHSGETATSISLQIDVYAQDTTINEVKHKAQEAAILISEKIHKLMQADVLSNNFDELLSIRKAGGSFSIPAGKGNTTYYSILRYDIVIANK